MKRILSMILVIVMALGCFAVTGSCYYEGNPAASFRSNYDAAADSSKYIYIGDNNVTYTYDSKGNLIKEVYEDTTATYTYNRNNLLLKIVVKNSDGVSDTCTYTYNSNGYLIKSVSKEVGLNTYTIRYTYDSKGRLIKEAHTSPELLVGTLYSTYSYNSKGYLYKMNYNAYEDADKVTYTYDKYGKVIKAYHSVGYGGAYNDTYTYDSNGRITQKYEYFYEENQSYTTNYYYYNGILDYSYYNSYYIPYYYKTSSSRMRSIDGRIRLEYTSATYTGNAKTPNVTIDDLQKGKDYKVSYSNNVKPGTAKIRIRFLGKYATQKPINITFRIKSSSSSSSTYYKTTASLRLRKGPSTSYSTILTMPSGAKVKYLGSKSNGFYKVSYTKNGKTYTGWCSSSYLKKV